MIRSIVVVSGVNNNKGFTLLELLVIIGILGVFAVVGIQQFTQASQTAANRALEANVRALHSAA